MRDLVSLLLCFALAAVLPPGRPAAGQCSQQWLPGDPIPFTHGSCHATAVWDPDGAGPAPAVLVVGGRFAAGTLVDTSLVAFDGTGWSALGTPPFVGVRALTVWNGLFVAAGSSGLQHAIAIRDGTVWVAGGSAAGINDCTDTMAGFQGDLVRGRSTSVDGVR